MLTFVDHAFFVLLAVFFPIWAAVFGMRQLRRAAWSDLPRARLTLYRRAIAIQWVLTLSLVGYWIARSRSWAELGLVFRVNGGALGVLLGLAIVTGFILWQRRHALRDDDALAVVRRQLGRLELMLPHSPHELTWFYRLSVTAGVCEEVLYRGYVIWYLTHFMALIPAALVGAVMFGVAHSYQGPRGMAVTGAVGAFLGGVFLLTGSLYLGMVAHALMDLHSGHLGYVALTRLPSEPPDQEPMAVDPADDETPPAGDANDEPWNHAGPTPEAREPRVTEA